MPYFLRRIKYFFQRGIRGWADEDIWNFDDYLARIIIDGLLKLKGTQLGCPSDMWDAEAKNNECHKWQETLETMIQAFKAHLELKDHCLPLRKEGYKAEVDMESFKNMGKKAQDGMFLFIKYFGHLWD